MSNDWNNRIKGSKNVVGDGNVVNHHHEEHHHHHKKERPPSSGGGGNGGDDGLAMAFAVFFIAVVVCWNFVRHAETIYDYIELAIWVAACPYVGMALFPLFGTPPDGRSLTAVGFGSVLVGGSFLLAEYGQGRLSPQLLQFSHQAKNPMAFWSGLTEYGHQLVVGNVVGGVCVSIAVLFALLMGVRLLSEYLDEQEVFDTSPVLRVLNPFRPLRGGIFAAVVLLLAWAFQSGWVFALMRSTTS